MMRYLRLLLVCALVLAGTRGQVVDQFRYYCSNFCETCYHQRDVCEKCGERYYFHEFYKVCLAGEISGCKEYASRIVCSVCDEGYKNVKGVCERCSLSRCGKCETNINVCEQCRTGFTFSGIVAAGSTCDTLCQVESCKKCFNGSGSFCEVCGEGYRKTPSDTCERCDMEGCAACSTIKSTCDASCVNGYYWTNSRCSTCMTGCAKCSAQGLCLGCDTKNNYYMDLNRRCVKSALLFAVAALALLSVLLF